MEDLFLKIEIPTIWVWIVSIVLALKGWDIYLDIARKGMDEELKEQRVKNELLNELFSDVSGQSINKLKKTKGSFQDRLKKALKDQKSAQEEINGKS